MKPNNVKLEELWSKQQITGPDVDYSLWEQHKETLWQMSKMTSSCLFAVDVYKGIYDFASPYFSDLLGYEKSKIETIEKQGDYLESAFQPDDHNQLIDLQIKLSQFIYSLPSEQRNDYSNIFEFRVLNARKQYINVISRQRVLLKDKNNKAWIIMGVMDISPNQIPLESIKCTVVNIKTGNIVAPSTLFPSQPDLTPREVEILHLIRRGLLSKEIASLLDISLHTINNHRKNILRKLEANNSIEAIQSANKLGLFN